MPFLRNFFSADHGIWVYNIARNCPKGFKIFYKTREKPKKLEDALCYIAIQCTCASSKKKKRKIIIHDLERAKSSSVSLKIWPHPFSSASTACLRLCWSRAASMTHLAALPLSPSSFQPLPANCTKFALQGVRVQRAGKRVWVSTCTLCTHAPGGQEILWFQ